MSQSGPGTGIIISHPTSRTSIILKAGALPYPAWAKSEKTEAPDVVTSVTVTQDTRFPQVHIEITDILAFRRKIRIHGPNRSGTRWRMFRARTDFSRFKNAGLMMNHSLLLTTKGTEKSARAKGTGYRYVFPEQELFGVSL